MNKSEFGERLRVARTAHGMSADELGRRLKSTGQAYRRYERGEVMPKIDQLLSIADILGVTLESLVYGLDETTSIEVTVRPGDRVLIKGANDAEEAGPYVSPVKINTARQTVKSAKVVDN